MSIQLIQLALAVEDLTPAAKAVLMVLANHANDKHEAWPSTSRICRQTGFADRTVHRAVNALEAAGYISRERRFRDDGSQTSNIFRLNMTPEAMSPPSVILTGGSDTVTGEGVTECRGAPVTVAPHETSLNRKKEKTAGSASPSPTEKAFQDLWTNSTDTMRKRSSQKKAQAAFDKAIRSISPEQIVRALSAYLDGDADVSRSGGPGLHIWLADKLEHWHVPATDPAEKTDDQWRAIVSLHRQTGGWDDSLGPRPGEPGCLVPPALLLDVVA